MSKHKLSASALSSFLKSPKAYYYRYIARMEPVQQSVATFDHDKLAGILWAEFVHRFYQNEKESANHKQMLADWQEKTDGWVPEKVRTRLENALSTWGTSYYQLFDPSDGARGKGKSELFVENDRFLGYLDGLSDDGIVHEVKSTSRSPQIAGQLWKVQNSIQVKLYAVLTKAKGILIEFAYKDTPNALYRSQVLPITPTQLAGWETELNTLADYIYSLGQDPNKYVCNSDGCCITSKGGTWMCQYEALCSYGITDMTSIGFKAKEHRK